MRSPLPSWDERSADYANLFNPAFLAIVLSAACGGFESEQMDVSDESHLGMPFALLFLAVPMSLSHEFQEARPSRLASSLTNWAKKHPAITANMSLAIYSLVPAVREAIIYGLRAEQLVAGDKGRFRLGPGHGDLGLDVRTSLAGHADNAAFAGRWLAKSSSTAAILEAFGLRP